MSNQFPLPTDLTTYAGVAAGFILFMILADRKISATGTVRRRQIKTAPAGAVFKSSSRRRSDGRQSRFAAVPEHQPRHREQGDRENRQGDGLGHGGRRAAGK